MAEGAPLLREYGLKAHRGFESLSLRHYLQALYLFDFNLLFICKISRIICIHCMHILEVKLPAPGPGELCVLIFLLLRRYIRGQSSNMLCDLKLHVIVFLTG